METESIIHSIVIVTAFLVIASSLEIYSRKTGFPFSIIIFLAGLFFQAIINIFNIEFSFPLVPDIIYFIILPILLFESALHINFHQFRLQFKTISFIATFGILVSVFVTAGVLLPFIEMSVQEALLYGAIISATDPIAVISMFKSLGSPKRLALVAEGESMFNDATGVLMFKIIAGFTLASSQFETSTVLNGVVSFGAVFIFSIVLGAFIGYISSILISKIHEDAIAETTITAITAILSFILADHYLHLSGVICTVMAGITMGNIGRTKFSSGVVKFIDQFWEYTGFFAIAFVFFVTGLNLDIASMFNYIGPITVAIIAMLIARAVSTYSSFFISNTLPIFKDEPNIPLNWQHVLNWGGLRGVIPLVLVYSLPDDFSFKEEFLIFTLSSLLFTILINGGSIGFLIRMLKLHLPEKETWINNQEAKILKVKSAMNELNKHGMKNEYNSNVLNEISTKLKAQETIYKKNLFEKLDNDCSTKSLEIKSIEIEKAILDQLYSQNYINENVYFKFQSELYLQQDAIEYPEVSKGRSFKKGGFVDSEKLFNDGISNLKSLIKKYRIFQPFIESRRKRLIEERISLLHARIITSNAVIEYLKELESAVCENKDMDASVHKILENQYAYIKDNEKQIQFLSNRYPEILDSYQKNILLQRFFHNQK